MSLQSVQIEQRQNVSDSGVNFCVESIKIENAVTGTTFHTKSWPIPVTVLTMSFNSTPSNTGDSLNLIIAKNTPIGVAPTGATATITIFDVSSTVLIYIKIGYDVSLTDGSGTENLGRVISIDQINSTITVETPPSRNFAPNSVIKMSIYAARNFIFESSGRQTLGYDKITGTFVPANTLVTIEYINNEVFTKEFYVHVEYMY